MRRGVKSIEKLPNILDIDEGDSKLVFKGALLDGQSTQLYMVCLRKVENQLQSVNA
jgi:hypothetical protein